ncbi:hypothetical protein [Paenibacillus amylolyticus]|uniref:hypothetical protein n=1 Tax=Paenibacillus amylolyticus TaxID=1451 RepID=UPI003D99CAB0
MITIGRKMFWDKVTGAIIVNRSEMSGYVRESSVEEDFLTHIQLAERNQNTVEGILLEPGKYKQDFEMSESYQIKESPFPVEGITTLLGDKHYDIEFVYTDNPEVPETPTEPRPSITQQMDSLGSQLSEMKLQGIQQQQTITSLGQELATAKLEIIKLKGGELT